MKAKKHNGKMKDFQMIICRLKMHLLSLILPDGHLSLILNFKDLYGLNKL